ncbi:TORC2 subunit Bit61 [Schizosaccharomyces cryophilus OY26]|uniref:TORC2 subunit Bit61 n=1 Tax=Schizosaccharomyces cryophilus (strain OY26 / ATCC MYA-4695 / CBS 11777 / NBRC 106824 / NRRL Y48691) TaxID=653667 RepID=S9VUA0_SCHCR|nr:TORC2 subunit Bit61 [Schizosaccharomyces cryophilus OY26]EPY51348.1 TORC2 subunit Bit61 [Schizosaccharomyces cryophilus OY26]
MPDRTSVSSTSSTSSNWTPGARKSSLESPTNIFPFFNQDLEDTKRKETENTGTDTNTLITNRPETPEQQKNQQFPFNGQWPFSRRSSQSSSMLTMEDKHWVKPSKRSGKTKPSSSVSQFSNNVDQLGEKNSKNQTSLLNISPHKNRKAKEGLDISALQKSIYGPRSFLRSRKDSFGIFGSSIPQSLVNNQMINGFGAASFAFAKLSKVRSPLDSKFNANSMSADDTWSVLESEVFTLYNLEKLHYTVEDLNGILVLHLQSCVRERTMDLFTSHLDSLFPKATSKLSESLSPIPEEVFLSKLLEIWLFFLSSILPYIEGIFLPIKTKLFDIQEKALLPYEINEFCSTNREKLNVQRLMLTAFRDYMILPATDRIQRIINKQSETSARSDQLTSAYARLFQVLSMLASIHSNDQYEKELVNLASKVRSLLTVS